nr:MAG TPA: hypothetical protein [Caudoviricetes sp.]
MQNYTTRSLKHDNTLSLFILQMNCIFTIIPL